MYAHAPDVSTPLPAVVKSLANGAFTSNETESRPPTSLAVATKSGVASLRYAPNVGVATATTGGSRSSVMVLVVADPAGLPAPSDTVKVKTYVPFVRAAPPMPFGVHVTALPVPAMVASPACSGYDAPSLKTATFAMASATTVTWNTGATVVMPSLLDTPESPPAARTTPAAVGAVVSMTKLPPATTWFPALPAVSVPVTAMVTVPSAPLAGTT